MAKDTFVAELTRVFSFLFKIVLASLFKIVLASLNYCTSLTANYDAYYMKQSW